MVASIMKMTVMLRNSDLYPASENPPLAPLREKLCVETVLWRQPISPLMGQPLVSQRAVVWPQGL